MNKVELMGRLTRDPEVRYTQGEQPMAIARFTLAVNRKNVKNTEQTADFINCVAFGRNGEFAEKYLKKGTKIVVIGRIQTGSYTNKDGQKVYTTDVVVEDQEFAESKNSGSGNENASQGNTEGAASNPIADAVPDEFVNIDDYISDDELPFN